MKKPKPVSYRDVSTLAMTSGNEKKLSKVIHEGILKEWVGIGWIDLRPATKEDSKKYPE
jgi:hypothetical protein